MEAENTWRGEKWDLFDEIESLFKAFIVWNHVISFCGLREKELLVCVKDEVSKVFLQVAIKHSSIAIICDSTSVHSLSNKIPESIPWKLFFLKLVSLVEVHGNELVGNTVVRRIEVIADVPANLTKLLSLLDCGVEVGEDVKHTLELLFRAFIENLL
jgi:hypothetical protein